MLRLTKARISDIARRSILSLAVATTFIAVAAAQTEPQGLRGMAIAPVMYRATGHVGGTVSLPIEVQNLEPRPLRISLKIRAVRYSDDTYGANLDEKTKFDCSDWFATTTFTSTISSTSTYKIPLKCVVPKVEPGVYYCLGTIDPNIVGDNSTIIAQYQIPIIILVGKMPKQDLKFGSPVMTVQPAYTTITLPFINSGDSFSVIGATVQIRESVTGRLIATRTDVDRNLYPQTKRNLTFSIPSKLPDGQYIVQCTTQANLQTFRPFSASFVVNKGNAVPATESSIISLPPFTVDPGVIHESLPAGATRVTTVKFINQTTSPVNVAVTTHRLTQSNNGLFQVVEEAPMAPLTVETTPELLTIPGRGTSTLRVKISVAPGTKGDAWFAVSAVSTTRDSLSQEVYCSVSVPNTGTPSLSIEQKEVGKVNDVPISVDYEVTNTGDIALLPRVSAAVLEGGLTAVAKLEVPSLGDGGILPGATLHNRLMLPPNLKPGGYTVRLEYQYAEGKDGQALSELKLFPFNVPVPKKPAPPKKAKAGGGS